MVRARPIVVVAGDPGEVDLAVGPAAQGLVDHGEDRGPVEVGVGVPGHAAQPGAGEQLEAHHRRHRVAGQAEHRNGVAVRTGDRPERQRLGRLDRDLHPAHVADAVEHDLHEVEVAHAHAAAGDEGVAVADAVARGPPRWPPRRRGPGRGRPPRTRCSAQRQQGEPVRVADLAGAERPSRRRPARRRWRSPRRGAGGRPRTLGDDRPWPARRGGRRSAPCRPRAPRRRLRGRRRPGGCGCPPARPRARPTVVAVGESPSVSSTITTASAPGGIGAPVMMRTASPGPTGESTPDMPGARRCPTTRA